MLEIAGAIALWLLIWIGLLSTRSFGGPSGGYGLYSDGEEWGHFLSPAIAFILTYGLIEGVKHVL